jgi:hypothetical protein
MSEYSSVGYRVIAKPPRFNEFPFMIHSGLQGRMSWFGLRCDLMVALCNRSTEQTGIMMTAFEKREVPKLGNADATNIVHVQSDLVIGTVFRVFGDWFTNVTHPWYGHLSLEPSNLVTIYGEKAELGQGVKSILTPVREHFWVGRYLNGRGGEHNVEDVTSESVVSDIIRSRRD